MTEQHKDILGMVAEGKIAADEAEKLLAALEPGQPTASSLDLRPKGKAKYLRLTVETLEDGEQGRIDVRVPLQLLRAGVRLAALVPQQALGQANARLSKSGVPFDLAQLKPEQLEAFVDHLDEMTLDVDQPDAKVRVFCE
jgi:hypothetical protein